MRTYTKAERRILAAVNPPPQYTTWRVYYYANGKPIAMRVLPPNDSTGTLYYLHSDHLGSTSVTTCGNTTAPCTTVGAVLSRQRYYPYGEIRPGGTGYTPTTIGYTGQRREEAGLGSLMYYRARFYSPKLQRFLSADTIVPEPGYPQALNRYAYVYGSPLKYVDPSGNDVVFVNGYGWGNTSPIGRSDVEAWAAWIRAYKGWDDDRLKSFLAGYDLAEDPMAYLASYGIGIFKIYGQITDATVNALAQYMADYGFQDVSLVGHSQGGSLVMSYIAAKHNGMISTGPNVSKFAIVKVPNPGESPIGMLMNVQ